MILQWDIHTQLLPLLTGLLMILQHYGMWFSMNQNIDKASLQNIRLHRHFELGHRFCYLLLYN